MKLGTNIHGLQTMYPNYFGDPLTFLCSATMRLTFMVLGEMSQQL